LYFSLQSAEELAVEKQKQQGGYTNYRIKLKGFLFILKETNKVIGAAHFHNWQPAHSRSEIGYRIAKEEYRNKGYAKEAIKAMLDFGFKEMGLNRVEALTGPANEPLQRLVKSFGFRQEGLLREHYCKEGELQDSIIFSILKKEYKP
jgi:ribosomal-protein-alanine N-acetyltransferase